jgi:tetratricopeptide (TPR) repeat protein
MVLAPTTGWADGAADRLGVLAAGGTPVPPLTMRQRLERAERLLRGGVPKTASDEAERIATESQDPSIVVRALRVVADGARRLGQYEAAAKALDMAIARAPADQQTALRLEQALAAARRPPRARSRCSAAWRPRRPKADAAEAMWMRARALEDADRLPEAVTAYKALAARYPKREVAGGAMWRLGWSRLPQG